MMRRKTDRMSYEPTRDEAILAIYQCFRDDAPDENELSLRDKAARHYALIPHGGAMFIANRNKLRDQYIQVVVGELTAKQDAERRAAAQAILDQHRAAGSKGYHNLADHVAMAMANRELQISRPELFADRTAEFRELAYNKLRVNRPWLFLDLAAPSMGDAQRAASMQTPVASVSREARVRDAVVKANRILRFAGVADCSATHAPGHELRQKLELTLIDELGLQPKPEIKNWSDDGGTPPAHKREGTSTANFARRLLSLSPEGRARELGALIVGMQR